MTLLLLLACTGAPADDTSGASDDVCGDVDGPGTDTGNLPNVLGGWTSTFATAYFDEGCSIENLNRESEDWIGAFTLDGRAPDALFLEFTSLPGERYWGVMDPYGGVSFSGQHAHTAGTLYVQFGGMVFHDQNLDRDVIDGSVFMGLDMDGNGEIECPFKASWKAIKSGL